jgi:hypothetical protein
MTDAGTDRATTEAVQALTSRLRNRGEADDEPLAAEFIAWMKLRGWRLTPAAMAPGWERKFGGGAEPGDEYRAARAAIDAMKPLPEHQAGTQ